MGGRKRGVLDLMALAIKITLIFFFLTENLRSVSEHYTDKLLELEVGVENY